MHVTQCPVFHWRYQVIFLVHLKVSYNLSEKDKINRDFPDGSVDRVCLQCRRHRRYRFDPWVWKIPGGESSNLFQYFCLKKIPWMGNLVGYGPKGLKESDTTEQLSTHSFPLKIPSDPKRSLTLCHKRT